MSLTSPERAEKGDSVVAQPTWGRGFRMGSDLSDMLRCLVNRLTTEDSHVNDRGGGPACVCLHRNGFECDPRHQACQPRFAEAREGCHPRTGLFAQCHRARLEGEADADAGPGPP